jgi:ribosomal protein S18 acetylase RimI-like enzyme
MQDVLVRQVRKKDLDGCYEVESRCYTVEGATKERIAKRIELFPLGFLVAEINGRIVGIINSGSTDKDDIADEELKDMVGHEPEGENIVIFSLAVLPEFQKKGISKLLMTNFVTVSKGLQKHKILLICKENLIEYYQNFGFAYAGKSSSKHGGFEWHELRLQL